MLSHESKKSRISGVVRLADQLSYSFASTDG
jgi:hypothetical protein